MLDKNLQRVKISHVIGNQLPDFVVEEHPLFVDFLKQYYTSQEYQGGPTDLSENIDKYLNLENFQEENYLNGETKLNGDITYYDDVITVDSTNSWPSEYGLLKIDNEIITYTGKTATSFTGCIRGFSGIDNLHKPNNPEFLVFSTSSATSHDDNSTVLNLSNIFLKEFWKKLKIQFLPGFENRDLIKGLDQGFFLSRAKDFYASKGTDEALKILFKVLYGDKVNVIKPQEFLIKPSSADWLITKNIVVEKVSGNPLLLQGETLFQDSPKASGQIYSIELYSVDGNSYYLVKLSNDSVVGNFTLNGFTKNTRKVSTGDTKITVDSTLGFDNSGTLYVNGQIITYADKSSTQFLECSGITDDIDLYTQIHQNRFLYSYENGDITKKVELRVTGTLSDFNLDTSYSKYLSEGDEIILKGLGENIKRGEYNKKFDYWKYNQIIHIDLIETTDKFSSETSPTFVTTKTQHNLRRGDSVTLLTSGLSEINGTVSDIVYSSDEDRINNSSTKFEFTFTGALNKSLQYTLRKNINFANSAQHPNINGTFTQIQNTYIDSDKKNLYVTSSGLPSYEIKSTNRSVTFDVTTTSDTINTVDPHGFYNGQKVYLTSISGSLDGIITNSTYFVKKITDNSFKLSYSLSRIDDENYVTFSGSGTHRVTPYELYNKLIKDQKLFKKFPINPVSKTSNFIGDFNTVGLFLNGVEIKSNKSGDSVYYGQIDEIEVLNSGSGYDVISPPKIIISDTNGSGVSANACLSGKIDKIVVTNPGYDFQEVPSVIIVGGNGKNATAEAALKTIQYTINFNGSSIGVNTTTNYIGFSTYHGLKNGEEVIYQNLGNEGIGIGLSVNSTTVDSTLVNNSIYYVKVVNSTTIQLMNTLDNALVGINTIQLNQPSTGTHKFITKNFRKVLDFIQVTNPGEGYQNNLIEVESLSYPPKFPGISTAIVGINTVDSYIFARNHNFKTGEEIIYKTTGSEILGISTQKSYFAIKLDDSKFRLCEKIVGVSTITGIGTTSIGQNLLDNNYIQLKSIGSGTHTFNYPPIEVKIQGSSKDDISVGEPSAFAVCTGSIRNVFVKNGGSNYGSNIMNYDKQPTVTISNGSGALLKAVIVDGIIDSVYVLNGGSGYISEPELVVNGDGKYAQLKAIIVNESIVSVQIIDGGKNYTQEKTSIEVKTLGKNAKFGCLVQKWNVNSYYRYIFNSEDDGTLIPSFDENLGIQFMSVYAPKKLRRLLNDNLTSSLQEVGINTAHSPIVGWAYDGNPIYGPYGGNDPTSPANPKLMSSSYTQLSKQNRPSTLEFPLGFFIEDYEYTATGDLDEYNGRYCVTPEFPNGTYAYFSTLANFPYTLNGFKNSPDLFNFDLLNNQNSNLLTNGSVSRNTNPYRLTDPHVNYNGINQIGNKKEKYIVDSVYSSGISSIRVIDPGTNYKVGEYIRFDDSNTNGRGATAQIQSIKGQDIHSIEYSEVNLNNLNFVYNGSNVTAISTTPHNLLSGDIVNISGINNTTFKFFEGSHKITVSSLETKLDQSLGAVSQTGIITSIKLSESSSSNRLCVDDILKIGNEQMLIIKIDRDLNEYKVEREYNSSTSSSHTLNSVVTLNPKKFSYNVNNTNVREVIRENKVTYFDPGVSLGLGTEGTKYFIGYGVSFTSVGILTGTTTRIFFNSHSFNPSEFVQIIGGTPSGINTSEARITSVGSTFINIEFNSSSLTSVGNTSTVLLKQYNFIGPKSIYVPCLSCGCESVPFQTFEPFLYSSNAGYGITVSEYDNLSNSFSLQDNQIIYVTRLSEASNTLGIRTTRSGIGSLSTLYMVGIGTTGAKKHSLRTVNPVVNGNATKYNSVIYTQNPHGISTSSIIDLNVIPNRSENVIVKYNSNIDKVLINSISFESTAIGIGTTVSSIYLPNHTFVTGDKVLYTSQNPANPLINNQPYYVIKFDDNYIKLSNNYSDTLKNPPVNIGITTTGSGTHEISLINPRLSFTRGNSIGFGVSDSSLLNYELKFYLDPEFKNEYQDKNIVSVGIPGNGNGSTKTILNTDLETPNVLYYQLIQKNLSSGSEYSITVDKDVKDFCKIILNNSVYSGIISISGIGSTTLNINNPRKPEHNYYDSSNTSELNYTTESDLTSGGIDKIKILFEGVNYKKLPKIASVNTETGDGAILRTYSDVIGKIKSTSALNIGYNYSSDKTIVPKAELPTIIRVKNNYTIDTVSITDRGSGYLIPPTPIVLRHPNIVLETKLNGSSVNSVNITLSDGNLSEIPPAIVSTKNTNGVIITNAESDGTYNTLTLKRPFNGFTNFPFIVGDKVFVEGTELSEPLSNGGGYNSADYGYQTFEITSLINDENVSSLTYKIPVGFGTTGGIFDSVNSAARVINEKDLAKFVCTVKEQSFYDDELVNSTNGSTFTVLKNGWDGNNKLLKVINLNGDISIGSTIVGSISKTKATIIDIDYLDGNFKVDSFVKKNNGWQDSVGFSNDYFQRIHDSFYYQYFSYEIDGETPYATWEEPVNSLAHPAGFKAFSKLNIFSTSDKSANISIGSSNISLLIDINNVVSLYTKYDYDLGSEETTNQGVSKYIKTFSKKLVSYSKAITNKSLLLEDISPQFNGITSTTGGNVVGLNSFRLLSNGHSVLYSEFDATNSNVISEGQSIINIPNHNFSTGEKLIYDPGLGGSLIGIATTNRTLAGISTNLLPNEVFVHKINSTQIKLSGIKTDATTNNIFFTFRNTSGSNVAIGKTHNLSVPSNLANSRSLITIDNVIQSPIFRKNIIVGLSSEVGIGSTQISLVSTKNITVNTLLQVDDEILKVNVVGFGTTTNLTVSRGQLNTVATAHTVGAAITVLGGDYTISKGYIYFTTPPYGPVGLNTLQSGISTNSTFSGRVFYKQNYDTNYIFDDISDQFTGNVSTGKSFLLKSNSNNITGISDNNGIVLINNFFQRPVGVDSTTDYMLTDDGVSGITTISFTGNTFESIPRGGIINDFEVGVGTGYTGGSYSNLSLIGGSGSGAKVSIVVGVGGSVLNYEIVNRGFGYDINDVLYLQGLSPVGINSATFKVLSTYDDKFAGWTFGQLINIDDFSSEFNGIKKTFTLTKTIGITKQQYSIESEIGSGIELKNNLIILINDVLQIPDKDYTFNGGTQLTFTTAPVSGSKLKILYYQGSISDTTTETPSQTIKVGDSLKLESKLNIPAQLSRVVTEIVSSDKVQTTDYTDVGISANTSFIRPLTWTKQTSDLIIDSQIISKSRDYLEARIRPTTRLIKDFSSSDTVIYVQNAFPDFNLIDDINENLNNITIIDDNSTSPSNAIVSNVSAAGTITSLSIQQSGSGFTTSFSVGIYSPSQISEIGKNWSSGIITSTSTEFRDIQYVSDKFLYISCDNDGGISTSSTTESWIRTTPAFTTNNQLNGLSYGAERFVGIGSNAKVGYSTDNANSWISGTIYSYQQEVGGLGRYEYSISSTTRKFNSVAYGNGKFVAVGTGGTVLISDDVYPAANTWILDGIVNLENPSGIGEQWLINQPSFIDLSNNITSNVTNTLNSVIYSNQDERFVAVGNDGVIISSPIGTINNRQFRVDRESNVSNDNLNDIVYAKNKYVVVGDNGAVGYSTYLTGPWIVNNLPTSNIFNSVTFINDVFVAIGENGVVANSINGIDWFIKNSVQSTVTSITNNGQSVIGVGSDSTYFISNSEITSASITANIQNGSVSSFNIIDGGFGYTNASDIQVLIPSQSAKYEQIESVAVSGDYGKIVGIGTSASGIGTSSPMIIFSIQSDIGLNTTRIGGSSQLTPFVERSGISTGDYFVTFNTITGTGVTSIDITSGIVTVGVSTEYLDCVYIASKVDNNGVSGIVTVYANVVSIVGVASTSVKVDAVGLDTTGRVGEYSWGKFYNFTARQNPLTFTANNKNSFSGIQTSPLIFRSSEIKAEYE